MVSINPENNYIVHLKIYSISLFVIVALAFTMHLFVSVFSGGFYLVLLFIFTIIFVLSKGILLHQRDILVWLWYLCFIIVFIGFFRSARSNDALLDLVTIFCGILLIRFVSLKPDCYRQSIKLIIFIAIFFSLGVYLQRFLPSVFSFLLNLLPSKFVSQVLSVSTESGFGIRGFTTNTGFTAGYICAGVIALFSFFVPGKRVRPIQIILFLFYIIALLYTGKRGSTFFLFLTLIFCTLIRARGSRFLKILWRIFLVLLGLVVFYFLFAGVLNQIPLFARLSETIQGLRNGDDVTSLRLDLYAWSWNMFKSHPLFGVGWSTFRTTVVGNVSVITSLEVHNIYLQLLCETGLVGFICFVITFFSFWIVTLRSYCRLYFQNRDSFDFSLWSQPLFFSLIYQTYFLLYGLTSNVLYDQIYQILYLLSCSILVAFRFVQGRNQGLNKINLAVSRVV